MKNVVAHTVKTKKHLLQKMVVLSLSVLALGSTAAHAAVGTCPNSDTIQIDKTTLEVWTTVSGWRSEPSHLNLRFFPLNSFSPAGASLHENQFIKCEYTLQDMQNKVEIKLVRDQDSVNAEPGTFRIFPDNILGTWSRIDKTPGNQKWVCDRKDYPDYCEFDINYTPKDSASHLRSPF